MADINPTFDLENLTGKQISKLLYLIHDEYIKFDEAYEKVLKDESPLTKDESFYFYKGICLSIKYIFGLMNLEIDNIDELLSMKYCDFKKQYSKLNKSYNLTSKNFNINELLFGLLSEFQNADSIRNLEKYKQTHKFKYLSKLFPFELLGIENIQDFLLPIYPIALYFLGNDSPFVSFPNNRRKIFLKEEVINEYEKMKYDYISKFNIKNESDVNHYMTMQFYDELPYKIKQNCSYFNDARSFMLDRQPEIKEYFNFLKEEKR